MLAVPGKPAVAGLFEPGLSGFADGLTSSFVFVVGGDVSDAGVQANGIPVRPHFGEFGAQRGRVGDRAQMRVLGPAGVAVRVQHGPRITAIILYLYVGQFLSKQRTALSAASGE